MDAVTLALAKNYTDSQRIAYTETAKTVVFPETVLTFGNVEGMNTGIVQLSDALPVSGGDTLSVVYDGTKYETAVIAFPGDGLGEGGYLAEFGNLSIAGMGNDTGEPFMAMYTHQPVNAQFVLTVIATTADTSHTVTIYKETETIHPIDPKYLPEGVGDNSITLDLNQLRLSFNTLFSGTEIPLGAEQIALCDHAFKNRKDILIVDDDSVSNVGLTNLVKAKMSLTYVYGVDGEENKLAYGGYVGLDINGEVGSLLLTLTLKYKTDLSSGTIKGVSIPVSAATGV